MSGRGAGAMAGCTPEPNCCRFPISTSCSPLCPRRSGRVAFQNKAAVYAILFAAAAEAMMTLAANPRRLGRPDGRRRSPAHMGPGPDASSTRALRRRPAAVCRPTELRWIAGRPNFFLAVRPFAKLFRRLFLERLQKAYDAGILNFFGDLVDLANPASFGQPSSRTCAASTGVVYAKKPFGGTAQALAYLGRYTHRVAIANSRLAAIEDDHVGKLSPGRIIARTAPARS